MVLFLAASDRASAMDKTPMQDFILRNWDVDDGMPSTHVNAVARTPDGFVWLATARGLTRFDGVHFTAFDVNYGATVDEDVITCLLVDRDGDLWLGTAAGRLLKHEKEGLVIVSALTNSLPGKSLQSLAQDAEGMIWLATDGGGLIRFDHQGIKIQTFTTRDGLPSNRISKIVADAKGKIWIIAEKQLLRFDGGHWLAIANPPGGEGLVQTITPSQDGGLWVATLPESPGAKAGLSIAKFRDGRWTDAVSCVPCPKGFPRASVTALLEDRAGRLWCGSAGFGVMFREPGRDWQQLAGELPISQLEILCLDEDESGTVWIGTRTAGLQQVRPKLVKSLALPPGFEQNSFLTVCASRDGSVWGGTDGAGVFRWRDGRVTHFGIEQGLASLQVNALLEDERTDLWAGTAAGVFVFDGEHFQPATASPALRSATLSLFEDKAENLWAGTANGLVRWKNENAAVFGPSNGLPPLPVQCLSEDSGGRIWAGISGAGVFTLDGGHFQKCAPTRRIDNSALNAWFDATAVRALLCDEDGSIWVGTAGFGLEQVKNNVIDQWKWHDDGLPSNHQFGMMQDGAGNLWVSSENGIFGYSKSALEKYRRGQNPRLVPWRLTGDDGLAYKVCSGMGQPCGAKSPGGEFWFPDGPALVSFDPLRVPNEVRAWPAEIEAVVVDGMPLALTNESPVQVNSGARAFEFQYTSPNIIAPEKICYRYQLEGLDKDWVEAGNARVANYNRLPPGRYIFHVMASGPEAEWPPMPTSLELVVVPRFYERRSMQVAGALIFVLLVAGTVWRLERARSRRRLERLKMQYALDRERQRIARDIHDDLGSGLTQIILLSDSLREEVEQLPVGEKMVREIAGRARSLTRAMDEVVWAINPRNDTMESFLTYLNKFAQEYLTRAGVHCRWDVPLELPALALSAETRHNLYLASKETLNNIVKHAGASEVWIRAEWVPGRFRLAFEDNGKGFETDAEAERGNGLPNIRHRLADLHGQCDIVSTPGKGTKVELVIQVGKEIAPDSIPAAK